MSNFPATQIAEILLQRLGPLPPPALRLIFNNIQGLINQVKNSDKVERVAFNNYVDAITPLENNLFQLLGIRLTDGNLLSTADIEGIVNRATVSGDVARGIDHSTRRPDGATVVNTLTLVKLVGDLRRPLFGRSARLVNILLDLDELSENQNREGLKVLVDETIDALNVVKETVTDVRTFPLTSQEYKVQDAKLQELFTKIDNLFPTQDLTSERGAQFEEAVEICKAQVTKLRNLLGLA